MFKFTKLALAAALLVSLSACDSIGDFLLKGGSERRAKERVEVILHGIQTDGGGSSIPIQASICMWYNETLAISDLGVLARANDSFLEWQREGGIFPKLKTYEVTGANAVKDSEPPTVLVAGKIDGKSFVMRVPHDRPISWVRHPKKR